MRIEISKRKLDSYKRAEKFCVELKKFFNRSDQRLNHTLNKEFEHWYKTSKKELFK